ncbi:hypothetical protein [Tolypothrix sp. VBCCA 56010]|uniref:hypothetical protein n=1 Tax=Tolypothrix sp. VBCCA 56010 TaxID=3137731 RepID=UPI003D7CBFC1
MVIYLQAIAQITQQSFSSRDRVARPVAQLHSFQLPRCKATREAFLKEMPQQHTDDRSAISYPLQIFLRIFIVKSTKRELICVVEVFL